uniref:MARVEL domain-containing protein n=1 Tax=Syphacia muris TaxID=451379 RepID=A0A0N5AGP7_9BILA
MPKGNLPLSQESHRVASELEGIWDENAIKYKCCCRKIHVKNVALFIGYAQMFITFIAAIFVAYYYLQAINGNNQDYWVGKLNSRYLTSFLLAFLLQILLALMLVHGIRTEQASFLLPFIIFASIAIFIGIVQIAHDIFSYDSRAMQFYNTRQWNAHLFGTLIHVWCVAVIWRCYRFLGDKKVARQISNQLSTTHLAFDYGDIPYGYVAMPQPPPYADTVISGVKQPLTIA